MARRAGVTHAAPYRHFANKEALLADIAEDGFRRLRETILARISALEGGDVVAVQLEAGVAYVLFAASHPAHFKMMFSDQVFFPDHPALLSEADQTFGLLMRTIINCQQAGKYQERDATSLAISAWAAVNGLALLLINNQLRN